MKTLEIEEDSGPRASTGNGSLSPMYMIDNLSAKNFIYNKLPDEPLKLTILKLDGSSFGIDVAKSATVGDLKKAIEDSFSNFGPDKVSWSHVWGNFCLSYDETKLLNDSDLLGSIGIKDGDQLHFIRHDPTLEKPRISGKFEKSEKSGDVQHQEDEEEDSERVGDINSNNNSFITRCEFKLTHLLCGWFSYSKLTTNETSFEQDTCSASPGINHCCGGNVKNIFRLYSKKC